jgi:peptide/nickel transport system substrate-binding protein
LPLALLSFVYLMIGAAETQAQSGEKLLVIGHAEITDSLDPARGFTTSIIFRATYDTLVTFPDGDASQIVSRLASRWTISEEGKVYTFRLREGVSFANGDPLRAEDVVFSMRRLQNMKGNPAFLADPIRNVRAVDDQTVVFTLGASNPAFLAMLANSAMSITNARAVRQQGGTDAEDAAKTDRAEPYLNGHSVGTGPYVLDRWDRQVRAVLVRNPRYWGRPPHFDRVIITNIPAGETQKQALQSGQIDLATDLSGDQVADLERDASISVFRGPSEIIHFLLMNRDPAIGGPVSSPVVGLAMRYALDYAGYRRLWKGSITPGTNLMVGLAGAYGQERSFKRDVARARGLLAQAGFPNGFDLTLDYANTTYGGVNFNTNAQKIQADLAEVGIRVKLNPGEWGVSLEAYRNAKQGFGYWLWGPNILDPSDLLSFLPGGTVGKRANWHEGQADPTILALRQRAAVETEPDARLKVFAQIQDYLQQQGPFAPFNQPSVQTAFRSDIKGYVWHPSWQMDVSLLSRSR